MLCPFPKNSKDAACPWCGYRLKRDYPSGVRRECPAARRAIPFGSLLGKLLSALGIRKRPGCGCTRRQTVLDRWSVGTQLKLGRLLRLLFGKR